MIPFDEIQRKVQAIVTARMEFENRALKLVSMRLADAGISPILVETKRCHFEFDRRVTMLYSQDPAVNDVLERCIVDAAATMVNDCVDQPFPFLPRHIVKEWVENAKRCPLDEDVVDVWIADLAVEARARRAEKIANGDLP